MKLIEMEKVLSELCLSHKDIIYIDKNETAERIRKIPSIDIVRCKECKWCLVEEGGCERIGMVLFADEIENHFCGYGERRRDE